MKRVRRKKRKTGKNLGKERKIKIQNLLKLKMSIEIILKYFVGQQFKIKQYSARELDIGEGRDVRPSKYKHKTMRHSFQSTTALKFLEIRAPKK